jgi:hypothetical protein
MNTIAERPLPLALYVKRYLKMTVVNYDGTNQQGILQAEREIVKIYLDGYLGVVAAECPGLIIDAGMYQLLPEELTTLLGFRACVHGNRVTTLQFLQRYLASPTTSPSLSNFGHYLIERIEDSLNTGYKNGLIKDA